MSAEPSAKKLKQTLLSFRQPIVTKKANRCVALPTPLCSVLLYTIIIDLCTI